MFRKPEPRSYVHLPKIFLKTKIESARVQGRGGLEEGRQGGGTLGGVVTEPNRTSEHESTGTLGAPGP